MPAVIAVMFLIAFGLAAPVAACGAGGASTFCADGWIEAPVTRGGPDRNGGDPAGTDGENPVPVGDIYVEGAVAIDDPPAVEDPL